MKPLWDICNRSLFILCFVFVYLEKLSGSAEKTVQDNVFIVSSMKDFDVSVHYHQGIILSFLFIIVREVITQELRTGFHGEFFCNLIA